MKKIITLILLSCVQLTKSQIINTVAGNGSCCNPVNNVPATTAALYYPNGVAVDMFGNIFISEPNRIRKVNTLGTLTNFAGSTGGYSGDGGPATSALLESYAVAVDPLGNVYAADWYHHVIRKINTAGVISTFAGNGNNTFGGDGGQAVLASLNGPYGLTTDAAGNVYISDTHHNRIRKVNASGIITTVAGNGAISGYSGDGGPATLAQLNQPMGITFDQFGNLYIADENNHRIRKVNTAGIISTVAGNGVSGFGGDGGPATAAKLKNPTGVACDIQGNLFIADQINGRIRVVNSVGTISTLAGDSLWGFSGDGGPASMAKFAQPIGIATDGNGDLYIADMNNYRIRKITNITGIYETAGNNIELNIYPNPSNGNLNIETVLTEKQTLEIFDLNGNLLLCKNLTNKSIDLSFLTDGVYNLFVKRESEMANKKLVIIK